MLRLLFKTLSYVAKRVLDSGFHAKNSGSDFRYWIQDSLSLELGFQSLVGFLELYSGFQCKNSSDSGIRIPLHGAKNK